MKSGSITAHLAGAGLFAGAAAWSLHQQSDYIIASWVCGGAGAKLWLAGAVALILLLGGAWLSWHALRSLAADSDAMNTDPLRPRHFLAMVSVLAAVLFLFAIFLQAGAALFLPGCIG